MNPDETPLAALLRAHIEQRGAITVAEFMEWGLYHPEHGYYTKGPNIGPRGDFTTSPEASPLFGKLLARHASEVDVLLGSPSSFDLLECGPGRGTLAQHILSELAATYPDLYSRTRYHLVEISPALTAQQQATLIPAHAEHVCWSTGLPGPEATLEGALIANEFVDAFPVHVLELREGKLLEQLVTVQDGDFRYVYGKPSSMALAEFAENLNPSLADGERIEINVAAEGWIRDIANVFSRMVGVIIDYGDVAPARYSPTRRAGTMLGYHAGGVTPDILAHPGEQDLTALVDFTALQRAADSNGLDVIALTRQANFLIGLGLGVDMAEAEQAGSVDAALEQRRGLQALVSMEGLGRFHVLVLSKGLVPVDAKSLLSGLKYADLV